MAINTTTRQTTAFTSGNNFAFAFKVYEEGDVKVIRITTSTGAEEVLTITTHYTVTLNDDQNANPGGTVTLVNSGNPVNLGSGFNIVITSKVTPLQQTEITNQGGFFPEVINDVLDKAAILDQQQQSILDKTIRFPLTQTVGGLEITENAANRAGKVVQFDGSGDLAILATVDGRDVSADGAKLDTIETNAKDDQTAAEIRALVESANDSNVFTDLDHSKLNGIEAGATADQTASEIKALYEGNSNTNVFSDAQVSKLSGIEAGATGDQSASEIRTLVGSASDSNVFTDNDHSKLDGIEPNATADQTAGEIKTLLQSDKLTANELANNSVTVSQIQDSQITAAKLDPAAVITASEQASATTNDTSFLTSAAADARFFNISTGDTIKDGDTFPDNDTTIATTAAINDRIIDLVDDVGGFVPIANETSFPTANPDAQNGTGTVVSVKAASTNLTPSGTTVTIANGAGTGNTVTITGVPSVIPSGFGFIVETTSTTHTYTFHRLVPKATEVTTVAGKAVEIGRLGTADAVADMAILGTTDVVADMNMLATTDIVADMALLANTDVIADMALLAVTDVISDMNLLATSDNITAMDTCRDNISSITNASNNISSVNNFGDKYQVASSDPSTDGGGNALAVGDLYFNTSANELKVYNGSSWQGGVTAAGNFASITGNTFTGDNKYNDNVKALFGTHSDLEIFHLDTGGTPSNYFRAAQGSNMVIQQQGNGARIRIAATNIHLMNHVQNETYLTGTNNGAVSLYYDNSKKFETTSTGIRSISTDAGAAQFGTSGTATTFSVTGQPELMVGGGATKDNAIGIESNTTAGDDYDSNIVLARSRGTYANKGIVQSGDFLGRVGFYGYDGAEYERAAEIAAIIDGTPGINDMPTRLEFKTTQDGANVPTTKLKITNDGNVQIPANNRRLQLGASQQLYLEAFSTYGLIQNSNNGYLYLLSQDFEFREQGTNDTLLKLIGGGTAALYYDGSAKFQTTSTGVTVNSQLTAGTSGGQNPSQTSWATNSAINLYGSYGGGIAFNDNGNNGFVQYLESQGQIFNLKCGAVGGSLEQVIKAHLNAQVELYHNNSKKLETANGGIIVTDSDSTSYLNMVTSSGNAGYLYASGNTQLGLLDSDGAWMLRGIKDNELELYFDASLKLETTSVGVDVHGILDVVGNSTNIVQITKSGGHELYSYHDSGGVGWATGSGNTYGELIYLYETGSAIILYAANTERFRVNSSGSTVTGTLTHLAGSYENTSGGYVRVKHDSGKFTCGGGNDLHLYHNGTNGYLENRTNNLYIMANNAEIGILVRNNNSVDLYYNNSKKFETTSGGAAVVGDLALGNITSAAHYYDNGLHIHSSGTGSVIHLTDSTSGSAASDGFDIISNAGTAYLWQRENANMVFGTNAASRWSIYGSNGHFVPSANNTYDIGTTSNRVANVYTNDLHLSNEGSVNDVDGTWGSYTIQEGAEDLYLINRRNGKKYKFALMEVS